MFEIETKEGKVKEGRWIGRISGVGEGTTCLKDASSMAVGTEVAHPVNILDGVSKVPVAVSLKERGAAGDNSVEVAAETEANMVAAITSCSVAEIHPGSLPSIAEVCMDETQPVTPPLTSAEKVTCVISISRVQALSALTNLNQVAPSLFHSFLCYTDCRRVLNISVFRTIDSVIT